MTSLTCTVDGCERKHYGNGYCQSHCRRFRVYGDPLFKPVRAKDPDQVFAALTRRDGRCLFWTGYIGNSGYGRIFLGKQQIQVHRYAWERANGPIPDGLFIDHRCHNRACVDLDHLRLATYKQNNENRSVLRGKSGVRGVSWDKTRNKWSAKVRHNGKTINLGRFDDIEEAAEASRLARIKYHTHNDHDRAA